MSFGGLYMCIVLVALVSGSYLGPPSPSNARFIRNVPHHDDSSDYRGKPRSHYTNPLAANVRLYKAVHGDTRTKDHHQTRDDQYIRDAQEPKPKYIANYAHDTYRRERIFNNVRTNDGGHRSKTSKREQIIGYATKNEYRNSDDPSKNVPMIDKPFRPDDSIVDEVVVEEIHNADIATAARYIGDDSNILSDIIGGLENLKKRQSFVNYVIKKRDDIIRNSQAKSRGYAGGSRPAPSGHAGTSTSKKKTKISLSHKEVHDKVEYILRSTNIDHLKSAKKIFENKVGTKNKYDENFDNYTAIWRGNPPVDRAEFKALSRYTTKRFQAINGALKWGCNDAQQVCDLLINETAILKSALIKCKPKVVTTGEPLTRIEPEWTFDGVSFSEWYQVNKIIEYPFFVSTSSNPEIKPSDIPGGKDWESIVRVKIQSKSGVDMGPFISNKHRHSGQAEVLFPFGTSFKVKSINKFSDVIIGNQKYKSVTEVEIVE